MDWELYIFLFSCLFYFDACWSLCPFVDEQLFNSGNADEPLTFECPTRSYAPHLKKLRDPRATTIQGCECVSACGANVRDNFNCDWCETKNKCGYYSYYYHTYYDYCIWEKEEKYENQTWSEKLSYVLRKVREDKTPSQFKHLAYYILESHQTTFDANTDVLPKARIKTIHRVGLVCPITMEINKGNFTGIWAKNTDIQGILRLSLESKPENMISPGAAFKFFRTGHKSANILTLQEKRGLEKNEWNYFQKNFTTWLSNPKLHRNSTIDEIKSLKVTNCPLALGLSNTAKYDQFGNNFAAEYIQFPFRIDFVPTKETKALSSNGEKITIRSFLEYQNQIASDNFTIFNIVALHNPRDFVGEKIGKIIITDSCTSSHYGDAQLFFQHQRIEEDWELRQNWLKQIQDKRLTKSRCGVDDPIIITSTPPAQCTVGGYHKNVIVVLGGYQITIGILIILILVPCFAICVCCSFINCKSKNYLEKQKLLTKNKYTRIDDSDPF